MDLTGRDPRRAFSEPGALHEVLYQNSFKPTGLNGPPSHQGSKSSDYLTARSTEQRSGDSWGGAGGSSWSPRGKAFMWQGHHEGQPGPSLCSSAPVFPPLCCSPFLHVENTNTAQFSLEK